MDLAGRVVLITGGRRMGHALSVAVAARGADVVLAYRRSEDEATQVAGDVQTAGRRALAVRADVSRAEDCAALVDRTAEAFGRLDVLVNMASLYQPVAFDEMDAAAWDRQLGVDLRGSFLCARAAVPLMRKTGGGRIINFSDWVAASGRPRYKGYLAYYVGKAGVRALTEGLALELAGDHILVNAIAPGPVLAPDDLSDEERVAVTKSTPVGHWGGAGEIAKTVVALIESDFITGETIRVDGGRHVY